MFETTRIGVSSNENPELSLEMLRCILVKEATQKTTLL